MFAPINPRNEELRAQAMLDSLTDYNRAVDAFGPKHSQDEVAHADFDTNELPAKNNRNNGRSTVRMLRSKQAEQLSCC